MNTIQIFIMGYLSGFFTLVFIAIITNKYYFSKKLSINEK